MIDEPLPPQPPAAPLGRRVAAGAFDFVVLWALVLASFLVPLFLRGLVLPMWGVLLVMLGYQVVPLSAFRQTLGMRLFGVELVTRAGHAVGAGEVLFRELVGRGFFPLAFLGTIVGGFAAQLLHVAAFAMPSGVAGIFFMVSGFTVALAVLGHFLVFNRADGRSLADVIARSYVTAVRPKPVADDAEEAAFLRSQSRSRVRRFVVFELVCVALVFFAPWLLTQRTESTQQHAQRLKLRAQEEKAKSYPDDAQVLRELYFLQRAEGLQEEATVTQLRLAALEAKKDAEREAGLRKLLLEHPSDRLTVGTLLDLLEEKGRTDDAKAIYARYVDDNPEPGLRAGFASWLSHHDFHEEALAQMKQVLEVEPELEDRNLIMGRLYEGAGKHGEAQTEYFLATRLDPDDEDAAEGLARLDAELGPLSKPARAALEKQLKAEAKKAAVAR